MSGGIRIRLDLSDFVYRVESRRMMYLDTMVVRTLADLEQKIKEEHSQCDNNDLLMFLEDGFLLPTWEPIQILQPGDLIKVILQPSLPQSNGKDRKKRKRNMDESIELSAKKKSKILPKVFTAPKAKSVSDTERVKQKKNVNVKEDSSSSSDSDSSDENQNTNHQKSQSNQQQKNNALKSQAVAKKTAAAENDSSSSDSDSSDEEEEKRMRDHKKKLTARTAVAKPVAIQNKLQSSETSSSSESSDSSDSDNETNVAASNKTTTILPVKSVEKKDESSSSEDSSSSDEESIPTKESVGEQVTNIAKAVPTQIKSKDKDSSSDDDSSSESDSENTSNKPNKSTNISTNNTKASNNPENGSKRKRKRKRKNKNKNKLSPEEMPTYNVDFDNSTYSANTGDTNKKTNNSRIIFQDNEENVNNAQDNTEVEFSAEEIQKLYAMSKPATPVNNTSTPRENLNTGKTSVPLSECEQSIIQSPQNPRNNNSKVVAGKKSAPFAFQPRVLTIQELKNGVQKKSVNGINGVAKVQENKATTNGDTPQTKEKYFPPIDTSKDVYTNKSVVIVNPPDYSKLEAATVDNISIGDSVAFKMIEMSASYTPEVSDWKEGKVIARDGSVITFQVLRPAVKKKTGRFELEPEEEVEEEPIIQLDTRDILDPRQVSPPKV